MKLTIAQQEVREQIAPLPLLTKDQLIDWLIYHCPLFNSFEKAKPFMIAYQGQAWRCDFSVVGSEPMKMYEEMATAIIQSSMRIHYEITELYWYWTI